MSAAGGHARQRRVTAGSTTIRSASFPSSTEPMASCSPSAVAPPSVPSRSQSMRRHGRMWRHAQRVQPVLRVGARSHDGEQRDIRAGGHVGSQADRRGPASR